MIRFLLSQEHKFGVLTAKNTTQLSLCTDPCRLSGIPPVASRRCDGKVAKIYYLMTRHFGGANITKEHLGELYYPMLVAIRLYAYETVGYKYNRADVISYIAWHYYGQDATDEFIDDTVLLFLILKEYEHDFKLTLYSNVFEPPLPEYHKLCRYHYNAQPKYWGSLITEDNERDFIDCSLHERSNKNDRGSLGERIAMEFFIKNNIRYIYDKPVDYVPQFCNQEFLRPDFVLPDLSVVVEIHGPQHVNFHKGFHVSYDD